MTIAASIQNLAKDFPVGDDVVRILHDINADIRMGELTMLVGPSGCGKTTLISIITGILSSSAGDIYLLDKKLNDLKDTEKTLFRREHIGFIFQQYNLLPSLTAIENAAIPLLAAGVKQDEAYKKAKMVLDGIGMVGQGDKLPRQLSGGQQQRVAIARALVHDPRLIVCDEPTAALDAKTGQSVMQILRDIANDENRAVLIVTHDNRIYKYADRILEMSDGRIIGDHIPANFQLQES
jgi:putative ABC transport system ATP-binding protein